jgi:hypothetical protein
MTSEPAPVVVVPWRCCRNIGTVIAVVTVAILTAYLLLIRHSPEVTTSRSRSISRENRLQSITETAILCFTNAARRRTDRRVDNSDKTESGENIDIGVYGSWAYDFST